MTIRVNMKGVTVDQFTALPKGLYHCAVESATTKTSQRGSQYIEWILKVDQGDFTGRKLWYNTTLLPQSMWVLKRLLLAVGVPEDQLDDDNLEFELDDFIGSELVARVDHEMYQGETRQRVVNVYPPDYATDADEELELDTEDLPFP